MNRTVYQWITGFAVIKLLLHFLTNHNYGLHRDEFLYIDEGRHLAWGLTARTVNFAFEFVFAFEFEKFKSQLQLTIPGYQIIISL